MYGSGLALWKWSVSYSSRGKRRSLGPIRLSPQVATMRQFHSSLAKGGDEELRSAAIGKEISLGKVCNYWR